MGPPFRSASPGAPSTNCHTMLKRRIIHGSAPVAHPEDELERLTKKMLFDMDNPPSEEYFDRVRSSAIREGLFEVARGSIPHASWTPSAGGGPGDGPGHAGGTMSLGWPGNALGSPLEELEEVSGERDVWVSLLSLLPPRPGSGLAEDDDSFALLGLRARLLSSHYVTRLDTSLL
ncbi:hypothetical protein CRENBAI_021922 [Crenichthys baileyi]|uniref:Uncharacterized protein n=1 Tax=Crenichthys baileyi TaxID=28760 RepID=A0AAV9QXX9_9TELE